MEVTANIRHSQKRSSIEKKQVKEDNKGGVYSAEKRTLWERGHDKEQHTSKAGQWNLGFSNSKTAFVGMRCLAASLFPKRV